MKTIRLNHTGGVKTVNVDIKKKMIEVIESIFFTILFFVVALSLYFIFG